ncbi:MAG: DUF962 domain-containing protein [Bdellovibrionales bacterium]|nr:DUF962 domain-containing protein [Bdellovibrionales bacterium]
MIKSGKFEGFDEFWLFYLGEHRKPVTRAIHFVGTSLGICSAPAAVFFGEWQIFLVGIILVYCVLFSSHFLFEKNRPATFRYPLLSIAADLKMWWLILTGRIQTQLDRINRPQGERSSGP